MYDSYEQALKKIFRKLGACSFGVLILITFLQVITRYLFSYSFPWAEEFLGLCFTWMILFGMLTTRQIQVSLIRSRIAKRWRWVVSECSYLLILAALFALFTGALVLVDLTKQDTYSALPLSRIWFYIPLVVATVLEGIRVVMAMVDRHASATTGDL